MVDVFKNYGKYKINSKKQSIINSQKFSLDAMTVKLGEILSKYEPKFDIQPAPQKVDIKLPKLKSVNKKLPKMKLPKLKKVGQ